MTSVEIENWIKENIDLGKCKKSIRGIDGLFSLENQNIFLSLNYCPGSLHKVKIYDSKDDYQPFGVRELSPGLDDEWPFTEHIVAVIKLDSFIEELFERGLK